MNYNTSVGRTLTLAVAALALMLFTFPAVSQSGGADGMRITIPAGDLNEALKALARQTGVQILYDSTITEGKRTHGVKEARTAQDAIVKLLEGTKLTTSTDSSGAILIVAEATTSSQLQGGGGDGQARGPSTSQQPASTQAQEDGLAEVLVTAQKRVERVRDVPMSISSYTANELHVSGIESTKDLTISTPGLVITKDNGVLGIPSIRGVGAYQQGITFDPGTAVYVDGVYSPRFGGTLTEFADVKRVEVLKGPQVVLYGRNATAGAVNLISNDPRNEFGGDVKVQFGNYGLIRVDGNVDIPLVSDKLLFRAFAGKVKDDGFMENVLNPKDHPGRQNLALGRFALKYLASDDLDVTLRGYVSDEHGANNAYKAVDPTALGSAYALTDPRKVSSDQATSILTHNDGVNITVDADLHWAKLTSITAYARSKWGPNNFDADSTELPLFSVGVPGQPDLGLKEYSGVSSQEAYLVGRHGELDWLAGASYLHEHASAGGASVIFGTTYFYPAVNITNAYAGYGQLSYALTEKLHATGGVRYSYETKEAGRAFPDPNPAPLQYRKASWNQFTYSGSLKYNLTDDTMIYATGSTGFKSGGFDQFSLGPPLNEEKIVSYEIGAKSAWLANRLVLDVSAFRYRYTNLQISVFTPPSTFSFENAGAARGQGMELSLQAVPVERLTLNLGLSLLDARYTKYDTATQDDPPVPVSYSGNRLANAPRATVSIGAAYGIPIRTWGTLTSRVDYYHSTRRFFDSTNNPLLSQAPYEQVNARVSFAATDDKWSIALFGKNLTDRVVYENGYILGSPIYTLDAPRTYGVELGYHF